jgi:hypothetical protein
VDVNSNVLLGIGKIWHSGEINFNAFGFGVSNVLNDKNLLENILGTVKVLTLNILIDFYEL